MTCVPAWVTTVTGGAPCRPCRSTSQPAARQHAVAGGGQGREVGHRGAGHEPDARAGGQAEQLDQPAAGDLLGDRGRRREDVQAGVLVPGRGQPVGAERGRQAAADHEAEVARARRWPPARGRRRRPAPRPPSTGSVGPSGSGPPRAARRAARSTGPPTGRVVERIEVRGRRVPSVRARSRARSVIAGHLSLSTGRDATVRARDATVTARASTRRLPWTTPRSRPGSIATSMPGGSATRSPSATSSARTSATPSTRSAKRSSAVRRSSPRG